MKFYQHNNNLVNSRLSRSTNRFHATNIIRHTMKVYSDAIWPVDVVVEIRQLATWKKKTWSRE